MKKFLPNEYRKDFAYIDIKALKQKGIKLIICDLDNTLVPHDEVTPTQRVSDFIQNVRTEGLQICLISNNNKARVEAFAKQIDVHFYSFAKKPLASSYRKIKKDYQLQANEIAAVGDQILTDVYGGNRQKMYTILTHPLAQKDLRNTKINRFFENFIFKRLAKKKLLEKGVFHE